MRAGMELNGKEVGEIKSTSHHAPGVLMGVIFSLFVPRCSLAYPITLLSFGLFSSENKISNKLILKKKEGISLIVKGKTYIL